MTLTLFPDMNILCTGLNKQGLHQAKRLKEEGGHIIGGLSVSVQQEECPFPLFSSFAEAKKNHKIDVVLIYSAPKRAFQEIKAALKEQIPLIICTTEKVPVQEMMQIKDLLKSSKSILIGSASSGLFKQGLSPLGLFPLEVFRYGKIGILSRSTSLFYEAANELKDVGISMAITTGAAPLTGLSLTDAFKMMQADENTKSILLIGEIGGYQEQELAKYYASLVDKKPLFAYIAGQNAPKGEYMGHMGAIISKKQESASYKKDILKKAGVKIIPYLSDIKKTMKA